MGIIVAGNGMRGNSSDQLSSPSGLFIHEQTNTLYVADTGNSRVQKFPINRLPITGTTVISKVADPTKIYIDDDNTGPTIYVSVEGAERIEKWVNGASSGVQVGDRCFYCAGVWVDKEKNVYISEASAHCVYKWSPRTNTTTVAAGRKGYSGSTSDRLNSPTGIYVDGIRGVVYVADYANNRIQKWVTGAENGTTVAGLSTGDEGSDAESLSKPVSIRVDDDTYAVYVVDRNNQRIQRWLQNASMGDTIAGGSGMNI
jgi:DNA-binding beta-propeller fold protein YncE